MPAAAPSRRRRGATWLLAAAGVASVVTACDKPAPQVTFQSGSRSVVAAPQRYCFTQDTSSCRTASGNGKVSTTLDARTGSTINISVPRDVASNAWVATAFSVGQDGTNTPIEGAGSNLVVDRHDAHVFVPITGTGSYLLSVTEVRGRAQTGTWAIRVTIVD